jgi:hypothetical protein
MRRLLIVAGALVAIGIVVVSLPFARPAPDLSAAIGDMQIVTTRCSAPIVSAWRTDHHAAGWFGYAPLTSTPLAVNPSCKPKARRRLAGGGLFVACGVAVAIVAIRRPGASTDADR